LRLAGLWTEIVDEGPAQVEKDNAILFDQVYEIGDAEAFGRACSHAWAQMREQRLARATSIGALFEELDNQVLGDLDGANLRFSRV
jgi:hypothetical protein